MMEKRNERLTHTVVRDFRIGPECSILGNGINEMKVTGMRDHESYILGPAADKLYAYENLGYSPEELKKMIARLKQLEEVTKAVSDDARKMFFDVSQVTCTNLPSPKADPITKVYNMAQMEQYFTDRNIKVIRKWGKCGPNGTNTRYTFTLTYAGVTQDYYFTYPDAVVYAERSKQMTKFCEGAYSCFDKYVRDHVRVNYMPARQNGKSLIDAAKTLDYIDTDVAITQKIFDMARVNANRTSLKEISRDFDWPSLDIRDLYPRSMIAALAPSNVIFNDPATIVFWNDGSKTVVRAQGEDKFDPEKGLAMAFAKKMFGNNHDYYIQFKRWLKKAKKGPESKKLEAK